MIEINKGEIKDHQNNINCEYKLINGNDLITIANASLAWQQSFVNHIAELRAAATSTEEFEKLFNDAKLGDAHWNWTAKSYHYDSDESVWFKS